MKITDKYNGGLTREQFLFFEIRILARLLDEGLSKEEAFKRITEENMFQFPTERMISSIALACFKRYQALASATLQHELANAPQAVAKQINLYAMMRYNRLVWDFMTTVIGEKFRTQAFDFSQRDMNLFFLRLQEQNDGIASWSEGTISKIKQVLKKALVECEFLDSTKATKLNSVFLYSELEAGIRENNDWAALEAFNHFD